jgi:hypothetical protein
MEPGCAGAFPLQLECRITSSYTACSMNALVRNVMIETVRQARELSRIVDGVPHAGLRGQLRESFLARALRPWLPSGMEVGTGTIVDQHGTSREVNEDDILIYATDLLPAILPLIDRNIFLLDAVVAHIEVKSTLTAEELNSAVKGAMSLHGLSSHYDGMREVRAVFAYRSTAALKSELARMQEQAIKLGWNEPIPPVSVICVDEKECYMHGSIEGGPPAWYNLTPDAPGDSTLAFISCIASQVNRTRDSRKFVEIARFTYDNSVARKVDAV